MKFRIHFEHKDGTEDSFEVSGPTIEDIQKQAALELFARTKDTTTDAWSEKLE